MSGILTYNQRYEQWKNKVMPEMQHEIEREVLIRLLSGQQQYQQSILSHTYEGMFIDKDLKEIYCIARKYLEQNNINSLNPNNLIISLSDKDVKYTEYIYNLGKWFICSADSSNWIMQLQALHEKRMYQACRTGEEFRESEKLLNQYKFQDIKCSLSDAAIRYIDEYDNKANSIIKTYYPSIDNLIGGFLGGNYAILAGATGMGKTLLALNLAIKMAKHNKRILFFSLEMTTEELLSRIIATECSINSEIIRNRSLSQEDWDKYIKYVYSDSFERLQEYITIPISKNLNIAQIEGIIRQSKSDICIIDYLGLVQSDNNKSNTYEQISDISRRLKLLAIETNKPIICLHQLNRDVKNRADKHPTLSDIRDSGKIEQDADLIMFTYRPGYYDSTKNKTQFEVMIAKSRHTGGAGKIAQMIFHGDKQLIIDPMGEYRQEGKQCTLNY